MMKIYEEIIRAAEAGLLVQVKPPSPTASRRIFLAEHVERQLQHPASKAAARRFEIFRATLVSFLNIRVVPRRLLRRLSPTSRGMWAIRCLKEPQMRVLGHFAAKDLFVALCCRGRDEFEDETWIAEMREVDDKWKE